MLVDYFDVQLLSPGKDAARKLTPFTNDRFITEATRRPGLSIRTKRSSSRGCGGGRPIWAILGRWSPELREGRLKKGLGTPGVF